MKQSLVLHVNIQLYFCLFRNASSFFLNSQVSWLDLVPEGVYFTFSQHLCDKAFPYVEVKTSFPPDSKVNSFTPISLSGILLYLFICCHILGLHYCGWFWVRESPSRSQNTLLLKNAQGCHSFLIRIQENAARLRVMEPQGNCTVQKHYAISCLLHFLNIAGTFLLPDMQAQQPVQLNGLPCPHKCRPQTCKSVFPHS